MNVPPGKYVLSGRTHTFDRPSEVRFIGTSGQPITVNGERLERPKFIPPEGFGGQWLHFDTECRVQGIDISRREFECGPRIRIDSPSRSVFEDIRVLDRDDTDSQSGALFEIASKPTATVKLESVRCPNGAEWSAATMDAGERAGRTGVYGSDAHHGTLRLENCEFSEFSAYGIDMADAPGRTVVTGGTYENSSRAQLRLGGPNDVVRDALARVDLSRIRTPDLSGPIPVAGLDPATYADLRGIRICRNPRQVANDSTGPSLSNVRVEIVDSGGIDMSGSIGDRAGGVRGSATALQTTVEQSTIRIDIDAIPAIRFEVPAPYGGTGNPDIVPETDVRLRNVALRGDAVGGTSLVVLGRSGTFRGCIERDAGRIPFDASDVVVESELRTRCREF